MKITKFFSLNFLPSLVGMLLFSLLSGCVAPALEQQEPLLPEVEGEKKFSDRFRLDEEPQFFYDLFGRELLEGNEVYNYRETKEFDRNGELVVGWTGQLDSERYVMQLDRTILTEDNFKGRYVEFAIGDSIRLKPATLFPNSYIIHKTEFDGFRWDLSFSRGRHLFTLLNSRISNPSRLQDLDLNIGRTIGFKNGYNKGTGKRNIENSRLVGFRTQGLLGDIFRVGFTYLNLHREHPERAENPFMGTVANTPPETIVVLFRDDSPEDNSYPGQGGVGVALKSMKIGIKVHQSDTGTDEFKTVNVSLDELEPVVANRKPRKSEDGNWLITEGFAGMYYTLDLARFSIDPRSVKDVKFDMRVAGDYNIVVTGFSEANKSEIQPKLQEWIKTEDGHIEMPYRDVMQAPGNYGRSKHYRDNRKELQNAPDKWRDDGKARNLSYRYGAARAATLYGIDIEGTVPRSNTFVRMHYSINGKYKQYPTVSRGKIGFSRVNPEVEGASIELGKVGSGYEGIMLDENGIPTYSEVDGDRFEARLDGDPDSGGVMGREHAIFLNLKQRVHKKLQLEGAFYHIDPGYTTTYKNFGAQIDRDERYVLDRTAMSTYTVASPYDNGDYILVEDDDDNDDWPDDIDFDGVLPRTDDRDLNGILDYREDFLIFDADPPIFEDIVDLNHNGVIDSLEDNYEPEYEYGINRSGYHLTANYDATANLNLKAGILREGEVSSGRRNKSTYLHLNYVRDIPAFGIMLFQNRFARIQDDIPDYAITLEPGAFDTSEVRDNLDYYNVKENISTLQLLYTAVPKLTLEAKMLLTMRKQMQPSENEAIVLEGENQERVDLMVPEEQVRATKKVASDDLSKQIAASNISDKRREYPFYPDATLVYDEENWEPRNYPNRKGRSHISLFKAKYEVPLTKLPYVDKLAEDLTVTPMFKYTFDRAFSFSDDEITKILDPVKHEPTDPEPIEYLRFHRRTREGVLGVRLDYQFTPRMNIIGGYQLRNFRNLDNNFKNYIAKYPDADDYLQDLPLYRTNKKTRILEVQAISRGELRGFNIVILAGIRRETILPTINRPWKTHSNRLFVRAMMGF